MGRAAGGVRATAAAIAAAVLSAGAALLPTASAAQGMQPSAPASITAAEDAPRSASQQPASHEPASHEPASHEPASHRPVVVDTTAQALAYARGDAHIPAAGPVRGVRQRLVGELALLTTDTIGVRRLDAYRYVLRIGERTITLRVPPSKRRSLPLGATVAATGIGTGTDLAVEDVEVVQPAPVKAAATGTTKVLVILTQWTGNPKDSVTQASAKDVVFTKGNVWWKEASYGKLALSGAVTPWLTISKPSGDCYSSMDQVMSRAKAAAKKKGYDSANYQRTIVYFPTCTGGAAGWATVPGSLVWINGYLDERVTVHEQGHNYGLYHAHSLYCVANGIQVVMTSTPSSCKISDYGDDYDAMGASTLAGHFGSPYKNQLGWLGSTRRKTLAATDSVVLTPYERNTTGYKVAVRQVSSTRSYWVEYRTKYGRDADFPAGALGVQIRLKQSTLYDGGSHLLDLRPGVGAWTTVTLPFGSSWTSPDKVRFTVGQPTTAGVKVSVLGGVSAKVPSAPAKPAVLRNDASVKVTWTKSADNGSIITAYLVTTYQAGSTTALSTKTVTSTGATSQSTLVTGLTNGIGYQFRVRAKNAIGTSAFSPLSDVAVPVVAVPSVSVTSPAAGSTVAGTVDVTASATKSPISGAAISRVDFAVDGVVEWSDYDAPYVFPWTTLYVSQGSHTLSARAVDVNGRSATAEVTVTVDNPLPTLTITSPAAGATVLVDATTTVTVSVVGNGRVVSDLWVMAGDEYVACAQASDAEWACPWTPWQATDSVPLVARAYDDLYREATSPPVSVTVQAP